MNSTLTPLRPAMTALAAVIAFSSTPLLAQATDSAASPAAPVIVVPAPTVTPPAVEQTATPDASAAPAIAAPVESAPAPQPAMRTMSTPVIHTEDAPAVSQAAPQRAAPAKRSSAAAIKPAPVQAAAVKPQPAVMAAPVAAVPVAPVAALAAAPANPAPVAKAASVQTTSALSLDNEAVPIAIGLGLVILGGGAFAFSRRKRREDEDELMLEPTPAEAATMVTAQPIMVPKATARMTAGSTTLPNGFDISRFGRHAQAAYRGPTPDNPSFSLKRRLSRASFFDQREREAAQAGAPVVKQRATPVAAATAKAEQNDEQLTVRLAPQRQSNRFGYVFQK